MSQQSTAQECIDKIAKVASAVGFQAGVSASELAGLIVSFLYANPEHTERFIEEGTELFIDGTIRPEKGSLTYLAINGSIMSPADLRASNGERDQ